MISAFSIKSASNILRGVILKPKNITAPCKTVIVSHGFASNMLITFNYAKIFAKAGYVAFLYDFCMSGSGISSGKSTGMSILTEKENLLDLIDYVRTLDFVDENHLSLAGCSQGGLVTSIAAAERESMIERIFLYYPALCIPDDARRGNMITAKFDPDNVPETFYALSVKLGRKYVEDAKTFSDLSDICRFKKPVLIVHGIEDTLVNINYSRVASKIFNDCVLKEVHGDHGFIKKGFKAAKKATLDYLAKETAT